MAFQYGPMAAVPSTATISGLSVDIGMIDPFAMSPSAISGLNDCTTISREVGGKRLKPNYPVDETRGPRARCEFNRRRSVPISKRTEARRLRGPFNRESREERTNPSEQSPSRRVGIGGVGLSSRRRESAAAAETPCADDGVSK
ncbi:hypothetical protein NL676_012176 [Syzygium grande]|nr:hypothetical protein NL676_012176 [Syzygium grande]